MRKHDLMPVLLALLLAGLCLANLSGCKEKDTPAPDTEQNEPSAAPDPAPAPAPSDTAPEEPAVPANGPLTEEELKYFNEEFFNGDYMNIRNQFLSSVYETPADIDLFELFYCGTGQDEAMTDEEWTAFEAAGGFVETDVTRLTAAGADAVLLEYTGLTLAETGKTGMENFTYLPEFDAYYFAHGDTNYRPQVDITAGVREGDLLHLYYDDAFYVDGWKRVTLRETDGGCQFVSNVRCDESDVPNT